MSKFTERLRECEDDFLNDEAADIIDELERALVIAENDAASWIECEATLTEHGFDVGPSHDVLHVVRNALSRLRSL